jgi:hypothetical protein
MQSLIFLGQTQHKPHLSDGAADVFVSHLPVQLIPDKEIQNSTLERS